MSQYPFQPGDHLYVRRFAYTHHGLYLGQGRVIHYAGSTISAETSESSAVCIVSLKKFAQGDEVNVQPHPGRTYTRPKSIERARSKHGEDCYNVLTNNCEHFVNWCIEGERKSRQVEHAMTATRFLAGGLGYANLAKTGTGMFNPIITETFGHAARTLTKTGAAHLLRHGSAKAASGMAAKAIASTGLMTGGASLGGTALGGGLTAGFIGTGGVIASGGTVLIVAGAVLGAKTLYDWMTD